MYSLHPDKHYALAKLLAKRKQQPAPGQLVASLAQRLYEEQQKRAMNG